MSSLIVRKLYFAAVQKEEKHWKLNCLELAVLRIIKIKAHMILSSFTTIQNIWSGESINMSTTKILLFDCIHEKVRLNSLNSKILNFYFTCQNLNLCLLNSESKGMKFPKPISLQSGKYIWTLISWTWDW